MRKAIGVDIGGTNTNIAVVDESGRVYEKFKFRVD